MIQASFNVVRPLYRLLKFGRIFLESLHVYRTSEKVSPLVQLRIRFKAKKRKNEQYTNLFFL